jgi:hypothetical protein
MKRSAALTTALVAVAHLTSSPPARACQNPPSVACDLVPQATVVAQGASFVVHFTVTNLQPGRGSPPGPPTRVLDDLPFVITARASTAIPVDPGTRSCYVPQPPDEQPIDPQVVMVVLDDALSATADDATTWSGTFTVTPATSADAYMVQVTAASEDIDGDTIVERQCSTSTCVRAVPNPSAAPLPSADFEEPLQLGDSGSVVPFSLRVHRNGYDPSRPLTVRVIPENWSDAADIFPIDPPELAAFGVTVAGDEVLVPFRCTMHYPCFVGVTNVYHVSLWDGPVELWNSQYETYGGIAAARVDRAALARMEVVDVTPDSGGSQLVACEHGGVHLRLFARNPWMASFDDVQLALDVPQGLVLVSSDMHFHDNPMDMTTPTPAELAAAGTPALAAGRFTVDVPTIAWRYESDGLSPPIFDDLFEVELRLETAPDGLDAADPLAFSGLMVTGTAAGSARAETTPPLSLPVAPGPPPVEVSGPGTVTPLRVLPDKRTVAWEAGSASGSRVFELYRGDLRELHLGSYGACLAGRLTAPTHQDPEPPPSGSGFFYVVRGAGCGATGPAGLDSRGVPRPLSGTCP